MLMLDDGYEAGRPSDYAKGVSDEQLPAPDRSVP